MAGRRGDSFAALPPRAAAANYVARLSDEQRLEALPKAAGSSDTALLRALCSAGVSLDTADEYGLTPLHVAAWRGAAASVRRLAALGANPLPPRAHGGTTPATAAAANGHATALDALASIGADLDSDGSERGVPPLLHILRRAAPAALQAVATSGEGHAALRAAWCPARALKTAVPLPTVCGAGLRVLISSRETHAGAGSVLIDGAVPQPLLEKLDALFASLPL
eukprot:CAMPEP_0185526128 /NCGR_PEP_ID=MMETSP1366-20130426/92476_1 /TAXON_ID=38817 /ORGANISM="Gephyrocapsa oceanica, Strain RCC1303" /LENGTH=223 /DNA_ID=CAMNT_0028137561 /DNA_START=117 /DNA_END=785 /DNA_ORIENTATION=+